MARRVAEVVEGNFYWKHVEDPSKVSRHSALHRIAEGVKLDRGSGAVSGQSPPGQSPLIDSAAIVR